jgi:hypothetical protein
MVLVAGYFWAPLVLKALGAKGSPPAAIAASQASTAGDSSGSPAAVPATANVLGWEQVQQAIRADGLMASAQLDPAWRNPFAARPGQAATDNNPPAAEIEPASVERTEPAVPDISPAEAGLVLQSIAFGSRRRFATISGEVYREGETIPAASGTGEFKLTKVTRLGIELTQNGHPHWLEITRPQLAHGDQFGPRGDSK